MSNYITKIDNSLFPLIKDIQNINILELGVQKGRSPLRFLEICNKNNGNLYSVDIDDCSKVSDNSKWKFIQTRDDNFEYIKSIIPQELDVIFIDTLHEAKHVKKLICLLMIFHLPYLVIKCFYEINNRHLINFKNLYFNQDNFDLNFHLNFQFKYN